MLVTVISQSGNHHDQAAPYTEHQIKIERTASGIKFHALPSGADTTIGNGGNAAIFSKNYPNG